MKILRKTRQKMLTENKIRQYLIYAIGEIVLVVIGIYIALQLSITKENRKLDIVKDNYLNQLMVDFDKEIENLESNILFLDSCIVSYNTYRTFIKTDNLEPIQIIDEIVKVKAEFKYTSFKSTSIGVLESMGDIKLIPKKIRNNLLDFKRDQDRINKVTTGNYKICLNTYNDANKLGYQRIASGIPNIKKMKSENLVDIILTLEAGFLLKNFTDKIKINKFRELLVDVKELKDMIALELKEG